MSLAPARTDWRWAKAAEAAQYTDSQALYQLRNADEQTLAAYQFKRAIDRGLETTEWTPVAAAYELFTHRFEERVFVEGMLLAGADDATIAAKVPCDPCDVKAFHDLFFDIRSRLATPAWIVGQIFQGGLYGHMSLRDRAGIAHRIAWLAGPEIFESYWTGVYNPKIHMVLVDRIRDMLAKNSLINSMCMAGKGDMDLEILRTCLDETTKQIKETVTAGGSQEADQAILAFLRTVPLIVADPTDKRNLELPAEEPRASQYLAGPEVKDVVATNVR